MKTSIHLNNILKLNSQTIKINPSSPINRLTIKSEQIIVLFIVIVKENL